jgi:PAS domain S-box-containing protein
MVILADAGTPHPFATDAYFSRQHTKSALCMPVLRQAELVGLLYLENSLATHAFTPERVAVLELLASQAVISLENARLYADLQKENSERKRAEEALLESKQRFRDYAETASDWFWESGPEHELTDLSGNLDIFGLNRDAIIGKRRGFLAADLESEPEKWRQHMATLERHESFRNFEYTSTDAEGRLRFLSVSGRPVFDQAGRFTGYRGTTADLTERREAEERLRQSQKMESVGQLTGGIAHDFNNLLQGIIGSLERIQKRISEGRIGDLDRFLDGALGSANRAAALTHRLLAFSRRQPVHPRPVEIGQLIPTVEELLRRSIGDSITMQVSSAPDLWLVQCDPNQLESALLNLAINARDAMPDGGEFSIECRNICLDSVQALVRDVPAGDYVRVNVRDTGIGMPADVKARAFDPFYTTKPIGQGTGLGLSMIYGFVRQSEGSIRIDSVVNEGTVVEICLPRFRGDREAAAPTAGESQAPSFGRDEIVLVVEDESVVRQLIVEVLSDLGYHALEAADGPSALRILQSQQRVDLLVTDIGLPGLNGRQLADGGRMTRPKLKVLFMTGYAESAASKTFLDLGMEIIAKPFTMDDLASRIRGMIDDKT